MTSSNFLSRTGREYAIYVAQNRAIPRVNDGLKHVQRVALWLLRNKADKIKTVALGGEMAREKLYVHGDVSANTAIGMLAAPYKNNAMLIKGHGQFGSRVAPVSGIGAPRYTEVSRSKAAEMILYPDSNIVSMIDNYDGSAQEPEFFAPILPVVLLNGVSGIAVGWSTNILPRRLTGLISATQDALAGKKELRGLEPFYERYNIDIQRLGPNQYLFSGKVEILDTSLVRIVELPPGHSIDGFRKKLIQMEDAEAIMGFEDRSTREIDITVRFKRGSVKDWTPDDAIDFFKLREKKTERIVVLDWDGKTIITYDDPQQLVRDFVDWRLTWYRRRFENVLTETRVELNFWELLKILLDGGFTKRLGAFRHRSEMEAEASSIISKKKRTINDNEMARVTNLPTYRWTKEFAAEVDKRIMDLNAEIADYLIILASEDKLRAIFANELNELKKLKL